MGGEGIGESSAAHDSVDVVADAHGIGRGDERGGDGRALDAVQAARKRDEEFLAALKACESKALHRDFSRMTNDDETYATDGKPWPSTRLCD